MTSSASGSPTAYPPTASFDHSQGPPRKKMRKGTKSCLECRRRKIKCTFEEGRPQICNECYARGSTCIDQEHGDINAYAQQTGVDQSYSLRERVSQLEDLVRQVLHKIPEKEDASPASTPNLRTTVDTQAAEVLKSLKSSIRNQSIEEPLQIPGGLREDAPALTLFDNAVIARRDKIPEMSRAQYNKAKTLAAALNHLLPSPHDLNIILDAAAKWFNIWRQMFPQIADARCETIKESVSHSLRSEHPAEIAKTMLCIAISVHQMPPDFDWQRLQLRDDPRELMDRYINTIDQLITSDDEIAATIEGIECMVLEAKYHVNMGRPRRSWLLLRRAITFAQLLGLHRISTRKPQDDSDGKYERKVSLWCHLFIMDKFLSLVLGLPYLVDAMFCTPYIPPPGAEPENVTMGELFAIRMCPVVTKIIDRNQSPVPVPYSATLRIDQELEELKEKSDQKWWTSSRIPGTSLQEHFDRLQMIFMHHQTRAILHMPFMLKSSSDKRYQYSHEAALDSSREMIRSYKALRSDEDVGPYVCKLIDFQAFTAAMLLLLNLCGYSQHVRGAAPQQPDLDQDQLDSALIDEVISILQEASKESGGIVAAQSVKALEMLARVREGCPEAEVEAHHEKQWQGSCQISIPFFGTITLGLGKHFVPIRRGTYPDRAGISLPPRPKSVPNCNLQPTNTGLPTPPSLASCSTQPSPMSSTLDSMSNPNTGPTVARGFYGATTDYIAPGLGNQTFSENDDPFAITFDSFMALPPTDNAFNFIPPVGAGVFNGPNYSLASVSSGSGSVSVTPSHNHHHQGQGGAYPQQQAVNAVDDAAIDPSLGGAARNGGGANGNGSANGVFGWGLPGGLPGGLPLATGADLDHAWDWSGDLQW